MAIPGNWHILFDWNFSGTYAVAAITLASDNTFTSSEGLGGVWAQVGGMFALQIEGVKTTYFGSFVEKCITGNCTTFDGSTDKSPMNGAFFMLEDDAPVASRAQTAPHPAILLSGKRVG
jgi:hypothetical protein